MQTEPQSQQDPQEPAAAQQAQPDDPFGALVDELEGISSPDGGVATEPAQPAQGEPGQQAPQEPQQPEPLEPPENWSEEHKAAFRSQTPEAQRFLLERHRQMEAGVTQKFQSLAEKERALAGLEGLAVRLQQDPGFRQYVQGYFQQQAQQQQPEQDPQGELDPIDQIKQEAAEIAYERIKREQAMQARVAQDHEFQQAWNVAKSLQENDKDLYPEIKRRLRKYADDQEHPLRIRQTYKELDENPFFFLEMYKVMRDKVIKEQQQPGGDPQQAQQPQSRARAPVLERGGAAPATTQQSQQRKRMKQAKADALRAGTTDALAEFLDSSGLIDQLV